MNSLRIEARACLLLAVLGLMFLLATACDPGANITYVNNTTYKVRIYKSNNHFVADLNPSEERTFSTQKDLWTGGIVAKTQDGRTVFSIDLTWEQLKAQGYRIVISEEATPSPAAPTATPSLAQ